MKTWLTACMMLGLMAAGCPAALNNDEKDVVFRYDAALKVCIADAKLKGGPTFSDRLAFYSKCACNVDMEFKIDTGNCHE